MHPHIHAFILGQYICGQQRQYVGFVQVVWHHQLSPLGLAAETCCVPLLGYCVHFVEGFEGLLIAVIATKVRSLSFCSQNFK